MERYHAPLRSAFNKIRATMDRKEAKEEECLKLAVYAVNSVMGPEGLTPILLVFGALPRPARSTPSPTQLVRQAAIEEERKRASAEQAKLRLAFALKHPSRPKAKESSSLFHDLPSGSKVLVYRTKSKRWEGPYTYISSEGETIVVQLPQGRRIFRSTGVKPLTPPLSTATTGPERDEKRRKPFEDTVPCTAAMTDSTDGPVIPGAITSTQHEKEVRFVDEGGEELGPKSRKLKVKKGSKEDRMFAKPLRDELEGLVKNGTFKRRKKSEVPK